MSKNRRYSFLIDIWAPDYETAVKIKEAMIDSVARLSIERTFTVTWQKVSETSEAF